MRSMRGQFIQFGDTLPTSIDAAGYRETLQMTETDIGCFQESMDRREPLISSTITNPLPLQITNSA
jgi:hypothetical protein